GDRIKTIKSRPSIDREYLLNNDYSVYQPGSFYRKSAVESAGFLNQSLNFCMDLDLWLNILKTHEARYIGGSSAFFRWHQSSKTLKGGQFFLREIYSTLDRHNARFLPRTKRRIIWYSIKVAVKQVVSKAMP
ncbi:MAG TPA: hypothetical protein VEJ88_04540, partial [Dissulfurispiraceae bacterium]|nr:hypothetical protein [Dissulfurispiraceae bacterium]